MARRLPPPIYGVYLQKQSYAPLQKQLWLLCGVRYKKAMQFIRFHNPAFIPRHVRLCICQYLTP